MTESGQVFSINCSPGGVPKLPIPEALITAYGLFGDSQANRVHHGGPDRAVCLFSAERILALQKEGHPIGPREPYPVRDGGQGMVGVPFILKAAKIAAPDLNTNPTLYPD